MTTFINFFGGPGAGKSTAAATLFTQMKKRNMKAELVTEVAKDFVWEDREKTLKFQPYVTAKQYRNLVRLKDKVDYVITDAPVLMGYVYAENLTPSLPKSYFDFIVDVHNEILTPSVNFFIERHLKYDIIGRFQTEDEAKTIDKNIEDMLSLNNIDYTYIYPNDVDDMVELFSN